MKSKSKVAGRRVTIRFSCILTLVIFSAGFFAAPALAEGNINSNEKYAWSCNAGWINFRPEHGGVTIHDEGPSLYLTGFAWSENTGWIKLGCDAGGPYANSTADNWGVNMDSSGNLTGYGWSSSVGWINFNTDVQGPVVFDFQTGEFDGYAWGENIGWIKMQNDNPRYVVASPRLYVSDTSATESSGIARFTISLNRATGVEVTVDFTTADHTAIAGEDYTELAGTAVIAPGDRSTFVDIEILTDDVEESSELFYLDISNPTGATILTDRGECEIGGTPFVETTPSPVLIEKTSAYVSGIITESGGFSVSERGFCWNSSGDPTTADESWSEARGTGTFSTTISDLTPGTTYYYRAFGVNTQGVAYGLTHSFITLPATTMSEATPMQFGTPYSAEYPDRPTWYKLDLVAGQGIYLALNAGFSTAGSIGLLLYDEHGHVIGQSDNMAISGGESTMIDTTVSLTGTYYAVVTGDSYVGNYDLIPYSSWFNPGSTDSERDFQSSFSTAVYPVYGNHDVDPNGEQFYRVVANSNRTITVNVTPTLIQGSLAVTLYDRYGNPIDYGMPNGGTSTISYPATEDGVCYFGIRPDDGAMGYYSLSQFGIVESDTDSDEDGLSDAQEYYHGTNLLEGDTDGDGVSDYDELAQGRNPLHTDINVDDHGTSGTAMAVDEQNTPFSAQIPGTPQTWYVSEMQAGQILTASLSLRTDFGAVRLSLLDADENTVVQTWNIQGDETGLVEYVIPSDGMYYFMVENLDTRGSYVFEMGRPFVDLGHAIGVLKIVTGIPAPGYNIDADGDGKTGVREAVFVLQVVSGNR